MLCTYAERAFVPAGKRFDSGSGFESHERLSAGDVAALLEFSQMQIQAAIGSIQALLQRGESRARRPPGERSGCPGESGPWTCVSSPLKSMGFTLAFNHPDLKDRDEGERQRHGDEHKPK
jgi:hypothetical protein